MIKSLILAIQFLTRIPININVDFNEENLGKSTFFFPFVGILLGSIIYLIYSIFNLFSKSIASIFSVLFLILLTGGLHLDGLADTCDGFFSYREKEEVLKIMKDSRIGAFGVISLILIILLKFIIIWNIDREILTVLIFSIGNSRLIQSHKIGFRKMAKNDGLGYMFKKTNPKKYIVLSTLIYISIIIKINIVYLIPLFFNFIFGEIITYITYNKIGGFTGDVLGATAEIGEVVSLLSFLGVIKWM